MIHTLIQLLDKVNALKTITYLQHWAGLSFRAIEVSVFCSLLNSGTAGADGSTISENKNDNTKFYCHNTAALAEGHVCSGVALTMPFTSDKFSRALMVPLITANMWCQRSRDKNTSLGLCNQSEWYHGRVLLNTWALQLSAIRKSLEAVKSDKRSRFGC